MAAGNRVMAAAMQQRQREAGRLPPTKNGRMREGGELPQTNAAIAANPAIKMGDWLEGEWVVGDMAGELCDDLR